MTFSSADRSAMGLTLARWGVIGMAASMPISRAIFNTSALLMLVGWVLSGNLRGKWQLLKHDPVVWACVALFGTVVLSALHSAANPPVAWAQVLNYSKLLYVPLILSLLTDPVWKQRAWRALLTGLLVTLITLWLDVWIDIPGTRTYHATEPVDKGVFYHHIAQGMALAFLAAYALHRAWQPGTSWRLRILWLLLAGADVAALIFINESRAAQLSALAAVFLVILTHTSSRWRWSGLALAAGLIAVLALGSSHMQERFKLAWSEASSYQTNGQSTSVGARLQAWEAAASLIREQPVLGHGAGAYRGLAYQHFEGSPICQLGVCEQPHNQFIMTTVESGLLGLLALLALLVAPMLSAGYPGSEARLLYLPFVGIFLATALFDSSLVIRPQAYFVVTTLGILMASRNDPARTVQTP